MTKKIKNQLTNTALLLVSLSLSLIVAEFSLRYYKAHINPDPTAGMIVETCKRLPHAHCTHYQFDEQMNYLFQSSIAFNNWTFRSSQDYSTEKEPGEYRIAILGDSYTENLSNDFSWVDIFAQAVEHNEALKKALHAKKITVANFANTGTGIIFMATQLQVISKLYKPDLAIFAFIDEDFSRLRRPEMTKPADTVAALIASHSVPAAHITTVRDAPEFELQGDKWGTSRVVYYNGSDAHMIDNKEALKKVHHAMIAARVHKSKMLLWQELNKLWDRWTLTHPSAGATENKNKDRDTYFSHFEESIALGRANSPSILFINLPTYYEVVGQLPNSKKVKPFVYWPDSFKRRPEVPLISLRDYLPAASSEERARWFALPPWDFHPNNGGVKIYSKLATDLITRYLEGDHSVLVKPSDIERELTRHSYEVEQSD